MQFNADVNTDKEEQQSYNQKGLEHMKQAFARTPGKVIAEI